MNNTTTNFEYTPNTVVKAIFKKSDFSKFFIHSKKNIVGIKISNKNKNIGKIFVDDKINKYIIYTRVEYLPRVKQC